MTAQIITPTIQFHTSIFFFRLPTCPTIQYHTATFFFPPATPTVLQKQKPMPN
jgi:hypothetical protein